MPPTCSCSCSQSHCETCRARRLDELLPVVREAVEANRSRARFADPDELVQDVLLGLFRLLQRAASREMLLASVTTIVRSVCANSLQRAIRTERNQGKPRADLFDDLPHARSLEHEVDFNDLLDKLLSRMPEKMQLAVRAVWIEGRTRTEVAAELNMKPSCMTALLDRAADLLRPFLRSVK